MDNLPQERIPPFQSLCQALRCTDHQVQAKAIWNSPAYDHRLLQFRQRGIHDNQQIHIALGFRVAAGIGAKQDDLSRLEKGDNLSDQVLNRGPGNPGAVGNGGNVYECIHDPIIW